MVIHDHWCRPNTHPPLFELSLDSDSELSLDSELQVKLKIHIKNVLLWPAKQVISLLDFAWTLLRYSDELVIFTEKFQTHLKKEEIFREFRFWFTRCKRNAFFFIRSFLLRRMCNVFGISSIIRTNVLAQNKAWMSCYKEGSNDKNR